MGGYFIMPAKLKEIDYIGKRYGRLTILRFDIPNNHGEARALCDCDCGVQKVVSVNMMKIGKIKSCGCYKNEVMAVANKKHGMSDSKIHGVWKSILGRCTNKTDKAYKNYGSRGITVCDEWRNDFKAFYDWAMNNGYCEGLTIERKDNDKGYSPNNCEWASRTQQSRNQRPPIHNKYGIRGINKRKNRWTADIRASKKNIRLGTFATKEEAIEARRLGEIKYWGKEYSDFEIGRI